MTAISPFAVPRSLRSTSRPPPPAPPSQPFDLGPVVPVEDLTERGQRFRCEPLRAKMQAGTCLDRQAVARGQDARGLRRAARGRVDDRGRACDAAVSCGRCELGTQVAGALRRAEGR